MTSIWEYLGASLLGLYGLLLANMYRWQMHHTVEASKRVQRLSTVEAQVSEISKALERIDAKLDRLIERGT